MIALAVLCLSAAGLVFQVLLVRLFAIEQFHHLASMAIGIAMLGSGVTGTLVALRGRLDAARAARRVAPAAVVAALALIAGPALLELIPLDPAQLPWRLGEWGRLGLVYAVLALPFAVSALPVLLALASASEHPGHLYGASFLGAGLGAVGVIGLLELLPPDRALGAPALLAAVGALLASLGRRPARRSRVAAWGAVGLAALTLVRPPWHLDVVSYKGLPQIEAMPDAVRVADRWSPLGWVVAVDAPAFRQAPGLSLAFPGQVPSETALFVDGELVGAAAPWDAEMASGVLSWLPASLPFAVQRPQRVLVLGAGVEIPAALAHGAREVTAVELLPDVARLVDSFAGPEPESRLRWAIGDARAFVASGGERYDLIALSGSGGLSGAGAGTLALSEDYLRTVEAYEQYLGRLTPTGMLAVTDWVDLPPRGSVRTVLTAAVALRRTAPRTAAQGLAVVRSWGTVTVLVKPAGFEPADLDSLHAAADRLWFDVDWEPGLARPVTRFNELERPVFFEAARAGLESEEAARRFAASYPFRVEPATDARPYPHHFLQAKSLRTLLEQSSGEWLPVAEWGYLTLLATLVQSALLGGLFLLVPTAARAGRPPGGGSVRLLGYFAALGVGYLGAELAVIQQLTLLLGHPVYAVSATLAVLLVASGVGSVWSDRLSPIRGRLASLGVTGLLGLAAVALLPLVHLAQPAPLPARALLATLVLTPLALLMGMPFALGLRALAAPDPARVAWAWAANGFASVIAAPLAALIALEAGSPAVLALAAGSYLVAALTLVDRRSPAGIAGAATP